MMSQFIGDENKRLNYLRVVADNERAFRGGTTEATVPVAPAGLPEWVKRFCADSARLKTYDRSFLHLTVKLEADTGRFSFPDSPSGDKL